MTEKCEILSHFLSQVVRDIKDFYTDIHKQGKKSRGNRDEVGKKNRNMFDADPDAKQWKLFMEQSNEG